MHEIMRQLRTALTQSDQITFEVPDPDLHEGMYSGTEISTDGQRYLYRSYRNWQDLAQMLECRLHTPQRGDGRWIQLSMSKLSDESFHGHIAKNPSEKYGEVSSFWQINKLEEPAFLHYFSQAVENISPEKRRRILDLGVHRGDEYGLIDTLYRHRGVPPPEFVGIDHSASAIAYAAQTYPYENTRFLTADINALDTLDLGRFDLLISIGTLQSPGIAYKPLLMHLVQHYLYKEDSALILGFPNCRWRGGEMLYGAKVPNYAMSEMSLLYSDVIFAKKYLQQHKYRVTVTGREYIFVTATKISSAVKQHKV
jgi:hypothetical protein